MTIQEMKASSQRWLTAEDVAGVLECYAGSIRKQAQADPSKLGFPVTVIGTRVKINRVGFLRFMGEM